MLDKVIKELSKDMGVPEEVIRKAYSSPFVFMKEKLKNSIEEKPSFNLNKLGKFYT